MNNFPEKALLGVKEKEPDYELAIIVTRHGPKSSMDGDLSPEGRDSVSDAYNEQYRGIPIDESVSRKVVASPVGRVGETAGIYQDSLRRINNTAPVEITTDVRLREDGAVEFAKSQPRESFSTWFKAWMDADVRPAPEIAIGKEAAAAFASWLLEELHAVQSRGGKQEVDAFSHGPVMAAFVFSLEEKLGIELIPTHNGKGESKYDRNRLFASQTSEETSYDTSIFSVLSYVNFLAASSDKEHVRMIFGQQTIAIPVETLEEIASFQPAAPNE